LYHLIGRLEEAEVRYQEALKLAPKDDIINSNLRRLQNLRKVQEEKQRLQRK
jgi:Flp pilus assembly protein TadD